MLATDASLVGVGGILYQEIDNVKKILYYHSELLSPSQKRYHSIELEALAIFKCVNRMKSYLIGRDIIIHTDNCPICHMMDKKISNRRVEKISILLQEFNIKQIIHVKGKYNCLPDYLSRHPIPNDDEFFDYDYGLKFKSNSSSSSVQLVGAVVTRSKSKANTTVLPANSTSPSNQQSSFSDHSSALSSDVPADIHIVKEHFDINKLKEHQQNDPFVKKIVNDLQRNTNSTFEFHDEILYKILILFKSINHKKINLYSKFYGVIIIIILS